jgi:hypothetical protein
LAGCGRRNIDHWNFRPGAEASLRPMAIQALME